MTTAKVYLTLDRVVKIYIMASLAYNATIFNLPFVGHHVAHDGDIWEPSMGSKLLQQQLLSIQNHIS